MKKVISNENLDIIEAKIDKKDIICITLIKNCAIRIVHF